MHQNFIPALTGRDVCCMVHRLHVNPSSIPGGVVTRMRNSTFTRVVAHSACDRAMQSSLPLNQGLPMKIRRVNS